MNQLLIFFSLAVAGFAGELNLRWSRRVLCKTMHGRIFMRLYHVLQRLKKFKAFFK